MNGIYIKAKLEELRNSVQVINIQQGNALIKQRPPNRISRPDRPRRCIPVSGADSFLLRNFDLLADFLPLIDTQDTVHIGADSPNHRHETRGCDWGDLISQVLVLVLIQRPQRRIEEVVTVSNRTDHVERGIPSPDDGDRATDDRGVVFEFREIAFLPERREGVDDRFEGLMAIGLQVDEEIQ